MLTPGLRVKCCPMFAVRIAGVECKLDQAVGEQKKRSSCSKQMIPEFYLKVQYYGV